MDNIASPMAYDHFLLGHSEIILTLTTETLQQGKTGGPRYFCLHGQKRMGHSLEGKSQWILFGSCLPI